MYFFYCRKIENTNKQKEYKKNPIIPNFALLLPSVFYVYPPNGVLLDNPTAFYDPLFPFNSPGPFFHVLKSSAARWFYCQDLAQPRVAGRLPEHPATCDHPGDWLLQEKGRSF